MKDSTERLLYRIGTLIACTAMIILSVSMWQGVATVPLHIVIIIRLICAMLTGYGLVMIWFALSGRLD